MPSPHALATEMPVQVMDRLLDHYAMARRSTPAGHDEHQIQRDLKWWRERYAFATAIEERTG